MSGSEPFDPLRVPASETSGQKIARLELENAWLREQNARFVERISALERRLGLNSRNSGQPPSSDGLKKPAAERRTRSLRGKTGRKPGGQAGHKGKTLCRTASPDRCEEHVPSSCRGCGASLSSASPVGHPVARQVFDLPEPRPLEVTEHRGHARRCGRCGEVTRAAFPAGVSAPAQYGPRLAGAAVWLRHAQFLPERRLSEVMAVLFGARVSPATLAAMSGRAAGRLRDAAAHIQDLAASKARVKHLDETGLRVGGRTRWLHAICTSPDRVRGRLLLAAYRVSERRGPCFRACPAWRCTTTGNAIGRWRVWSMRFAMRIACGSCRRLWSSTRRTGPGACSVICAGPGAWRGWRGRGISPFRGVCWRGWRAATTGCLSRRWRSMRASRRSRLPGPEDAGPRSGARAITSPCACMSAGRNPALPDRPTGALHQQ